MNKGKVWVACAGLLGLALLGGCTTQPRRVSCDGRLEPINAPAGRTTEPQDKKLSQAGEVAP